MICGDGAGIKRVWTVWIVLVIGYTGMVYTLATTYFYSFSACFQFSFPFFVNAELHCFTCPHLAHESLLREFFICLVAFAT